MLIWHESIEKVCPLPDTFIWIPKFAEFTVVALIGPFHKSALPPKVTVTSPVDEKFADFCFDEIKHFRIVDHVAFVRKESCPPLPQIRVR